MVAVRKKNGKGWEDVHDINSLEPGDVVEVKRNTTVDRFKLANKPKWDEFGGWRMEGQPIEV